MFIFMILFVILYSLKHLLTILRKYITFFDRSLPLSLITFTLIKVFLLPMSMSCVCMCETHCVLGCQLQHKQESYA